MRVDPSFQFMTIALIVTTVTWWVFCIVYHLRSKWWKNPYGQNMMSVGASVASLHTVLAVHVVTREWNSWATILVTAIFLWSAYAAGRRIVLVNRAQRSD